MLKKPRLKLIISLKDFILINKINTNKTNKFNQKKSYN